jgi:hypothetical protein
MEYPIKIHHTDVDPDVYCPEIWNRAYINQLNDRFDYKPCCYFNRDYKPKGEDMFISRSNEIYNDYNSAPFIVELREKNKNNEKHPGCGHCYQQDQINPHASGRYHAIREHGTSEVEVLTRIDLNLGNLCNLSCAICGPFNSSSWIPLYEKHWGFIWPGMKYKKNDRPVIDDPALFKSLKLVQLQGGEIFMEPAYYEFFRNMGKYRSYDDLTIWIFTNATTLPTPEFLEILNSVEKVRLFFSIDDIGKRFEYQRRGAKWDQVVENIKWFQANCGPRVELCFNITYSLYNIFYISELCNFLSTEFPAVYKNFTPFNTGLGKCSAQEVSSSLRTAILDKTAGIKELDFLADYIIVDENFSSADFLSYVKKYDAATDTSYADTHPEFYQLLINT